VQSKAPWWVGTVLAIAVVAAFAWFVWPTPWVHSTAHVEGLGRSPREVRRHRITGERQVRIGGGEWVSVPVDALLP
jgi:hypothetical protein